MSPEGVEAMRNFAQECLDGRTSPAALEVFLSSMYDAPDIAEFLGEFIHDAAAAAARALIQSVRDAEPAERSYAGKSDDPTERRGAYTCSPANRPLDASMIARWGASVSAGFNFILPDGQKLGDCTRNDLMKAAFKFETFGKEAKRKAAWLNLIAQGLPEGQTVRERFKPLRLTELAIEAEKAEKAKDSADV